MAAAHSNWKFKRKELLPFGRRRSLGALAKRETRLGGSKGRTARGERRQPTGKTWGATHEAGGVLPARQAGKTLETVCGLGVLPAD